ncbi:MAG TPA: hypothetical protein VGK09_03040 [Rhodocyclaceae bacterium]
MAGETESIARMANYVSEEILSWFRWKQIAPPNQNFDCVKVNTHAPKKQNHTHPVDTVFWYVDPYLNKKIYFNTDLKSYSRTSIQAGPIFDALKSLSCALDCARSSAEWQDRYYVDELPSEIRGLLFIYNHDREYDKDFYKLLVAPVTPIKGRGRRKRQESPVRLEGLPLKEGQYINILEPSIINYLSTIISDADRLHREGTFPETKFEFFYPELRLHKTAGARLDRPATIEALTAPFLIIRHEEIIKYNETTRQTEVRYPSGFVIYYNKPGSSADEFVYFLDLLSGYQILDGDHPIRIRHVCQEQAPDIKSNFRRAVQSYAHAWSFDKHKTERLESIEIEIVELTKSSFSKTNLRWERE